MKLYKFENGKISAVPRNGYFNGVAVSNLDKYLADDIEIANENGYYEMSDEAVETPTYDEATQYLEASYSLVGNKIEVAYTVKEMESEG